MPKKPNHFFKNISSNYFIYAAKLAVGLYALPVCLAAYGSEIYGLYLLSFGLSSALAAFDLGSSRSIYRYTIEFGSDNNLEKFKTALDTSYSFNLFSAILTATLIIILGQFSTTLFNLPTDSKQTATTIFLLAAINTFITMLDAAPQSLITANNLFHARNKYIGVSIILNLMIILAVQFSSAINIELYAFLVTITSIFVWFMDHELVKSKNLLKGIKVSFKNLTYLKRSEYADYSLQVFGLSLISFMAIQADKLIIAIVLDTSAVTLYTIITKPYVVFKGILAATIPVVQPKLNEYYFNNLSNNFIQLSRKFTRISFFIMLCCTILIGLYYKDLLSIWLKTNIYNSYANWGIISMATLCLTLFYTQFLRTLLHSNKIKYIIYFSIIGVSINVITSTILSYYIGFQGVIIGTTVQIALELIYYKYLERKFISTDKLKLTGYNYLIYIFTIILLSVVCFIMLEYFITTYLLKIVSFIVLLSAFSIVMYMILIKENIVKRATLH